MNDKKQHNQEKLSKQFRSNVEKYLLDPDDYDATNFLYNLTNIWINFFLVDYQKKWGQNFSSVEKQDLRQEIIIKFFSALRKRKILVYQAARSYLREIFKTTSIDFIRKKKPQFLRIEEEINSEVFKIIPNEFISQFSSADKYELIQPLVRQALAQLKEPTRTIINDSFIEDLPYKEISKKLGEHDYSSGAFKAKAYRARKAFQKELFNVFQKALSQKGMSGEEYKILEKFLKGLKPKMH